MRNLAAFALSVALSACSQQAAEPSSEMTDTPTGTNAPEPETSEAVPAPEPMDPAAISPAGIADIAIGKAPPASLKADAAQISDACSTFTDKARGIYAMVEGGVVTRITAMKASKVSTDKGIAVGTSEAAVRKAYPQLTETPHKYVDAPAKYLDWRPGGGNEGMRFEIDAQGRVSAIHAGREPAIEYVEGCA